VLAYRAIAPVWCAPAVRVPCVCQPTYAVALARRNLRATRRQAICLGSRGPIAIQAAGNGRRRPPPIPGPLLPLRAVAACLLGHRSPTECIPPTRVHWPFGLQDSVRQTGYLTRRECHPPAQPEYKVTATRLLSNSLQGSIRFSTAIMPAMAIIHGHAS